MIKEFKEFISRGNVIDLAVGVIIGGAFGKIVSSLVNDIIMPLIGIVIGGIDFSNLSLQVGSAIISYGVFIQNVIDFLIISICIFIFVKSINELSKLAKEEEKKEIKKEVKEQTKKQLPEEVALLMEIRDLLVKQNKQSTTKKTKKQSEK